MPSLLLGFPLFYSLLAITLGHLLEKGIVGEMNLLA